MFEAKLGFSGGGAEACLTQKIYIPWESFDIRQNLMTCYLQSLLFQILLEVLYIFYDVSV